MAEDGFMMKRLPATAVTPYGNGAQFVGQRVMTRDEADLTHYGKRQQFKVGYSIQCLSQFFGATKLTNFVEELPYGIYHRTDLYAG
jgi:hypothetical protein